MFFNYRPGFENSDFLGQLRAERGVANEIGLHLRAKFLKNVETLLQSFHKSGTGDTRDLKPTNGDAIEVIRMKMKNEAQKLLRVLDGRVEDDFSESEFEKPHDEELEDTSARCHVGSDSPKQPGSKKTYRYKCPICNENYTHIANHLKFFHKLQKEDVSKIRLQEKSKKIREAKSGNKRPLRPCPVKSCKWEGYRMDYHLPQKHNIKKGSKRYKALTSP